LFCSDQQDLTAGAEQGSANPLRNLSSFKVIAQLPKMCLKREF